MRALRLIVAIPLLILLVLFALTPSNRSTVDLGLWPTDLVWVAPLSLVVLAAAAIFFFLGALVVSIASLALRRRARRAESRVRSLEAELAASVTPRPDRAMPIGADAGHSLVITQ